MIDLRFRPIEAWPCQPARSRRPSPFRAGYVQTLDLLETELQHLRARSIVIQAGFTLKDIRNDGWPKSGARPNQPGVILSFDSRNGPLMFPCDTYTDWQANLRAIALSLEALRAVDRYGVTRQAEQYRGWSALPPAATTDPPSSGDGFASADQAAGVIAEASGLNLPELQRMILRYPEHLEEAYRRAAQRLHPDAGGSHEQFIRLQAAAELVRAEHARQGRRST